MRGLKKHSHDDRRRVIEEIVPLIRKKFGENLVALAATASYARNEDSDYSDLELTAFVETMPEGQRWGGVGKIRDGLLVELVWTTGEIYLEDTREVTRDWYLAGSDALLPIINDEFIGELNNYKVENLRQKCLGRAAKNWHEVQEATAKVLNATSAGDREGIPLLVFDMLRHMLIVLSFLNQTPYVTFARFISQARGFEVKPANFDLLTDTVIGGTYQDLRALEGEVVNVFSQFEAIFEQLGVELYDSDIDPD
jgi:hypothetical protein